MAKKKSTKMYSVFRRAWHAWHFPLQDNEGDFGVPVRGFSSQSKAKKYCQEQERNARLLLGPFQFCEELEMIIEIDEEEFCQKVEQLGLTHPTPTTVERYNNSWEEYDWLAWWNTHFEEMTEEQRLAIWDMTHLELFYVREIEWGK